MMQPLESPFLLVIQSLIFPHCCLLTWFHPTAFRLSQDYIKKLEEDRLQSDLKEAHDVLAHMGNRLQALERNPSAPLAAASPRDLSCDIAGLIPSLSFGSAKSQVDVSLVDLSPFCVVPSMQQQMNTCWTLGQWQNHWCMVTAVDNSRKLYPLHLLASTLRILFVAFHTLYPVHALALCIPNSRQSVHQVLNQECCTTLL